jgi:outer membrane protein assembly factor BamC
MSNDLSARFLVLGQKSVITAFAVCCLTMVGGCSLFDDDGMFRNRGRDYLLVEQRGVLTVPEGLDSSALGELYRVPEIPETSVLEETDGTPRPQLLSANVLVEEVKIQNLSGKRWILINRLPGEVWPRARNILNRNAVPAARVDAATGVIETVWLEFQDDPGNNHRYRFMIEQGVQPKSSEITVLHMSMTKGSALTEWPGSSDSEEREQSMLNVLASELSGESSSSTVSMLAQSIGGESKVDIVTPKDASPYVLLRLDYDRAWASVGFSVSQHNFNIIDQDRTAGTFYVHYAVDEDEEPGFIRRMLGAAPADKIPAIDYRVQLDRGNEGIEVRIRDNQEGSLERVEVLRLLKKIRANLS